MADHIPPLPTKIRLLIVSADRSLVNESVDEVEIPGADGYFGVLPGHTPLLAVLGTGELWYRQGQEKHFLALAFGFAEVEPDRVTILAQIAEKADEIVRLRREVGALYANDLPACAYAMAGRFAGGGRLFTFGNGGSSTDAQDVATTFLHPPTGRPLRSLPQIVPQHLPAI